MNESQMGWKEGRSERRRARLARCLGRHCDRGVGSQARKPERRCLKDAAQALAVTGPGCPLAAICGTAEAVWRDLAFFPRDALYT